MTIFNRNRLAWVVGRVAFVAVWIVMGTAAMPAYATRWATPLQLSVGGATSPVSNDDPHIAADGTGHWVAVWSAASAQTQDASAIVCSRSSDDGATWTPPQLVDPLGATNMANQVPQIATDKAGTWIAVWHSNLAGATSHTSNCDILYARSTDNGATWGRPALVSPHPSAGVVWERWATVRYDQAGHWAVAWMSLYRFNAGSTTHIALSRSSDGGATWTQAQALDDLTSGLECRNPALASDGSGHWIAAWDTQDLSGVLTALRDRDIACVRSSNNGQTWTTPARLNTNWITDQGDDNFVKLETDRSGVWIAAWGSNTGPGGALSEQNAVIARSTDNGASWSNPTLLSRGVSANTDFRSYPSLATDSRGKWTAAWQLGSDATGVYDVHYGQSQDNGLTWTSPAPLYTRATGDASDTEHVQVATSGVGRWLAAWHRTNDATGGHDVFVTALNGAVDASDIQLVINGALGLSTGGISVDINHDGDVDAVDVQIVINEALNG